MTDLLRFSLAQWRLESEMRIEDAYKWCYHATQGGEHAITSPDGPRRWLEREWSTLSAPMTGETLILPLRPDGKIVRLNLRPYRSKGGSPELLLNAFVSSAKSFRSDKTAFLLVWNELGAELEKGNLGKIERTGWERLDKETARSRYPAIDHSTGFASVRIPAYRVLTGSIAKRLTATLGAG
jgi:hypothetical protein